MCGMAISCSVSTHHFDFCKQILLKNCSEALKYLAFKTSCFDGNEKLETHYYRLKQSEIEQLVSFFQRPTNVHVAPEPCSHRFGAIRRSQLCNNLILRKYQAGEKTYTEVEKVTVSLINKCTNMDDALRLLTNLKQIENVGIAAPPFNALLKRILVFQKRDIFVNVENIMTLMRQMGVKLDLITCLNYLTVCAECGQFDAAKHLLLGEGDTPSKMSEFGLIPNIAICNAYLTVCAKTGRFKEAQRFLLSSGDGNMQNRWPQARPRITPNLITCMNYLTVCAECGQFDAAKHLLLGEGDTPSKMSEFGLIPDIAICSAYLTVCAKTGRFKEAQRFLLSSGDGNMQNRWPQARPRITPDLITCMNYLTVCAECGQFDAAKHLLLGEGDTPSKMSEFGLIPNIAICSAYLTVCAKTGRFKEAQRFLLSSGDGNMQNRWPQARPRITPNLITCLNYLTVCAECGQFDAAKHLLLGEGDTPSKMSEFGLIPNIAICNAYLTVCAKTGRFKEAQRFLNREVSVANRNIGYQSKLGHFTWCIAFP